MVLKPLFWFGVIALMGLLMLGGCAKIKYMSSYSDLEEDEKYESVEAP